MNAASGSLVISVSASARAAFQQAATGAAGDVLHLEVSDRFEHDLYFGPRSETDVLVDVDGLQLFVDPVSATRASGVSIDFVKGPSGAGFKIRNPNEPAGVKQIGPRELHTMMSDGAAVHVYDVRTPREREIARIERTVLLEPESEREILLLPRDVRLVFQCHHGGRSQMAAERFMRMGFTNVYNLAGGIDAWSDQIDPKIARY